MGCCCCMAASELCGACSQLLLAGVVQCEWCVGEQLLKCTSAHGDAQHPMLYHVSCQLACLRSGPEQIALPIMQGCLAVCLCAGGGSLPGAQALNS